MQCGSGSAGGGATGVASTPSVGARREPGEV